MAEAQHAELVAQPTPTIVYGRGVDPALVVNPLDASDTMQKLGISDQGIDDGAMYLDAKSHLLVLGTHYPNRVGRLRQWMVPELREVKGDIVRVSTTVRGKPRTLDNMNATAVHEWEHQAQGDRHDKKVHEGHLAIAGLTLAGAFIGNKLGRGKVSKSVGIAIGGAAGWFAGNVVAPHEIQARKRAWQINSAAIRRVDTD